MLKTFAVPIPMLRIEEMTIDFSTKISESTQQSTDEAEKSAYSGSGGGSVMGFSVRVSVSGSKRREIKPHKNIVWILHLIFM